MRLLLRRRMPRRGLRCCANVREPGVCQVWLRIGFGSKLRIGRLVRRCERRRKRDAEPRSPDQAKRKASRTTAKSGPGTTTPKPSKPASKRDFSSASLQRSALGMAALGRGKVARANGSPRERRPSRRIPHARKAGRRPRGAERPGDIHAPRRPGEVQLRLFGCFLKLRDGFL